MSEKKNMKQVSPSKRGWNRVGKEEANIVEGLVEKFKAEYFLWIVFSLGIGFSFVFIVNHFHSFVSCIIFFFSFFLPIFAWFLFTIEISRTFGTCIFFSLSFFFLSSLLWISIVKRICYYFHFMCHVRHVNA